MRDITPLLRESGAMLEGHFLLSSGRHGDRYVQCAKLMQYPDKAAAALEDIVNTIKADIASGQLKVDAVAGPAMGGVIVAYELARQLGLPAVFTERDDNNTMCLRRGFEIKPGSFILIAEDVVTTGKSSGECAAALEAQGASIAALACIADRRQPGDGSSSLEEFPWPFYPALKIEAKNWAPQDCELCKKGVPVIKPGSRKL